MGPLEVAKPSHKAMLDRRDLRSGTLVVKEAAKEECLSWTFQRCKCAFEKKLSLFVRKDSIEVSQ
jgi:hypothetical protein